MRILFTLLAAAVIGCGDAVVTPTSTTSTEVSIGIGLSGPPGLTATAYAAGLKHVSAFAFDDDDRLWVATASYDDDGSDAVYLIPAAGATPTRVIDRLHTPLGLLWVDDVLYVASAGRVDAYTAFDDASFTSRTSVLALPDGVGEVNGLAFSPTGRLLLGISAPCDACTPTTTESAAVISFLPDGSDVRIEASGIRAPIGLALYPGTDDLFVTMNQRDDLGDATPGDWLGVAESGQDWGFPYCYGQGGAACVGTSEPVAVLDPHAAVSGVAIIAAGSDPILGSSAFVAEWATGKVLRVALTNDAGVWHGTVEPFLTGFTNPVPVTVAPDGALLVGDWGTGTIARVSAGA